MQQGILLSVGSIKTSWISEGCMEYASRLKHDLHLTSIEVPASKEKNPERQKQDESNALLRHIEKFDGAVWVLDEKGKEMTSSEFSEILSTSRDSGISVMFVIGGAYGFTDAVRKRATLLLRLSAMTLPHELCQLLFLEQLYRALQIQKGTGYHH